MAKLKDVLEGKGSGEYFTLEEIEKKLVIVIEGLTGEGEIREHDTGKTYEDKKTGKTRKQTYYCVNVNVNGEVKDLHITWTGLTQLAKVMPLTGTWKGQQFVIDAVKTKGKLDITAKGLASPGTYETKQTTIPSNAPDVGSATDIASKLVYAVACSTGGLSDAEFWKHAEHLTGGNPSGAMSMVQLLKEQGRIHKDKEGFWMVGK